MSVTLNEIMREIKLLRQEIQELKEMLIMEAQPEEDEIASIENYEDRKKKGDVSFKPLEAI